MSYRIGQFRRDMLQTYLNNITATFQEIQTSSTGTLQDISFRDVAFQLSGNEKKFNYQKNYYIKLEIEKTQYDQNFQITLQNINEQGNDAVQKIKNFYIPAKQQQQEDINNTVIIQLVFNPIVDFTHLVIRLLRTYEDFLIVNKDKSIGRIIQINKENCNFYQIINILSILKNIPQFKKIGVQGPSGLLMCINGQEIRVGPSGIYQIKNGYKINFMGFIISENSSNNYFILDYQY